MISGYFIYRPDIQEMQGKLSKSIKSTAVLTLWATALYAFIHFIFGFRNPFSVISAESTIKLIFLNIPYWVLHLWYLYAYLYVLIIIYALNKYNLIKLAYYSIPILLLISVVFGKYSFFTLGYNLPIEYTRNFLFAGVPYFLIGALIKANAQKTLSKPSVIYVSFVIFTMLAISEHLYLKGLDTPLKGDFYMMTAPVSISILLLFLSTKQTKDNIFSKIGRKYSLDIYIFHMFSVNILAMVSRRFITNPSIQKIYHEAFPFLVFIITIIGSIILRDYIIPYFKRTINY